MAMPEQSSRTTLDEAQAALDARRAERINAIRATAPARHVTMEQRVRRLARAQRPAMATAVQHWLISRIDVRGFYLTPTIAKPPAIPAPSAASRIVNLVSWAFIAGLLAFMAAAHYH